MDSVCLLVGSCRILSLFSNNCYFLHKVIKFHNIFEKNSNPIHWVLESKHTKYIQKYGINICKPTLPITKFRIFELERIFLPIKHKVKLDSLMLHKIQNYRKRKKQSGEKTTKKTSQGKENHNSYPPSFQC